MYTTKELLQKLNGFINVSLLEDIEVLAPATIEEKLDSLENTGMIDKMYRKLKIEQNINNNFNGSFDTQVEVYDRWLDTNYNIY